MHTYIKEKLVFAIIAVYFALIVFLLFFVAPANAETKVLDAKNKIVVTNTYCLRLEDAKRMAVMIVRNNDPLYITFMDSRHNSCYDGALHEKVPTVHGKIERMAAVVRSARISVFVWELRATKGGKVGYILTTGLSNDA